MNRFSSIRYVMLIAMLLVSQVGSAYVSMPAMQDCGMDMSMAHDAASSEHSMPMMDKADLTNTNLTNTNTGINGEMDCCDPAMMASSVSACCDAQCQCSSFVSSIFLSFEKPVGSISYHGENVVIHRITAIHTPFLQQPKRPPISNNS